MDLGARRVPNWGFEIPGSSTDDIDDGMNFNVVKHMNPKPPIAESEIA